MIRLEILILILKALMPITLMAWLNVCNLNQEERNTIFCDVKGTDLYDETWVKTL